MANQPRVLLLGDADHDEFRAAIERLAATSLLVRAADVAAALEQLAADDSPLDVIVVAQPWSGAIRGEELGPLLARVPLARVLVLAGSWCEGEGRSGLPMAGAIRIPWHQWRARWERELSLWEEGACPAWSLPVTATEDDRLLHAVDEARTRLEGRVAIIASEPTAGWLAESCRGLGLEVLLISPREARCSPRPDCALVVFEVESLRCDTQEAAIAWARGWKGISLIGISNFPRVADDEAWSRAGVNVLLAQPVSVDDLCWHLADQLNAVGRMDRAARQS